MDDDSLVYEHISIPDDLKSKYDPVVMEFSDEELKILTVEDYVKIDETLASGAVVIVSSNLDRFLLKSNHVFDPNSRYSVVFFDNDSKITHCMSTHHGGQEAGNDILGWLDSLSELEYHNLPVMSYTGSVQNNVGKMTVTCLYYYLGESYGHKYYTTEYRVQSTTLDGDSKITDHYAECYVSGRNASMQLLDARPDNTYTMESTTVGVDFSIVGMDVDCSWMFTTPICKIHNLTDVSESHFNIWFDIDEDNCNDVEVTRSGCMVRVGTESHYIAEEVFEVQFVTPHQRGHTLSSISQVVHPSFN